MHRSQTLVPSGTPTTVRERTEPAGRADAPGHNPADARPSRLRRPAGPDSHVSRPNCAPAYYLGRPGSVWINVMKPRRRHTAPSHLAPRRDPALQADSR